MSEDVGAAVVELWDRLVRLGSLVRDEDWQRPTPCPGTDVRALAQHVVGVHRVAGAGADGLVAGLEAARAAQVAQISASAPSSAQERRLRVHCLDLWVHAYDLATALGEPVDLDEDSVALAEACRCALGYTPQLVARGSGAGEDSTVRIALRGTLDHDAAVVVRGDRGLWRPDDASSGHSVSAAPGAFVLLLSGRGDAEHWRDRGALTWSGTGGEAFVRKTRLFD